MTNAINANGKRRRPVEDDSETNAVEIRDAEEPFNQATADCILRSSDGMDFHVHKLVLSLASVVFESMFSLPTIKTRSSSSSSQEMRNGLPVIPLPEASLILDSLLRLCYPTSAPDLTQFTHARAVYDAIDKYAMDALAQPVKDALLRTARQDATTAYAFGCRHQISELVVTAAKETLNHPLDHLPLSSELDRITGTQLYRLIRYHKECKAATSQLATLDWTWIPSLTSIPQINPAKPCQYCNTKVQMHTHSFPGLTKDEKGRWILWCPKWWWEYMERSYEALKVKPRGQTVKSTELLRPALSTAVECQTMACRNGIHAMVEFSEIFAKAVEDAIDKVRAPY